MLGLFAPAATVGLLLAWLVTLIFGYGLVFYALRDQLRPVPTDLGDALYFAATSLLTLGFGDFVADGAAARIFVDDRRHHRPRRRCACGHVPVLAVRVVSAT